MFRISRRLAAGGLLAAVALLASPGTAHAATPMSATVFVANTSVAPGASSTQEVYVFGTGSPHNLTLTYDLASLPAHVAMDDPDEGDCTRTGTTVTCALSPDDDLDGIDRGMQITLSADGQATAGDAGKLKVTVDSDDTDPVTSTAAVTVGEGADLSAGADVNAAAPPGKHVAAGLTVRNSGDNTVHGAYLVMFGEDSFRFATRYSNCVYVAQLDEAYCEFDTGLAPGQTYGLSDKVDLQISPDTQAPTVIAVDVAWVTPQDWADEKSRLTGLGIDQNGPHGTASPLTLVANQSNSRAVTPPQTDVNPSDNFAEVTASVTGKSDADYAAIGAKASGNVGATVTIKVGLKNHGPAAIREGRAGDPTYSADVVFPKGVTTTAVPQDCLPVVNGTIDGDDQGKPGFGAYDCMAYQKVGVGDTVLISFSLRIDKALTDAKGSIVVGQPTTGGSADGWDHHLANNTADIVINPSGDSGSLPVTGSNAFAIAAVGALVVAAGVMLVWFGRRRRRVA